MHNIDRRSRAAKSTDFMTEKTYLSIDQFSEKQLQHKLFEINIEMQKFDGNFSIFRNSCIDIRL